MDVMCCCMNFPKLFCSLSSIFDIDKGSIMHARMAALSLRLPVLYAFANRFIQLFSLLIATKTMF